MSDDTQETNDVDEALRWADVNGLAPDEQGSGYSDNTWRRPVYALAAEVRRLRDVCRGHIERAGRLEAELQRLRAAQPSTDDWGLSTADPRFQPRPAQPPAESPTDGAVDTALAIATRSGQADQCFYRPDEAAHALQTLAAEVRRLREENAALVAEAARHAATSGKEGRHGDMTREKWGQEFIVLAGQWQRLAKLADPPGCNDEEFESIVAAFEALQAHAAQPFDELQRFREREHAEVRRLREGLAGKEALYLHNLRVEHKLNAELLADRERLREEREHLVVCARAADELEADRDRLAQQVSDLTEQLQSMIAQAQPAS